jgi:hypothetical protein
MREAAMGGAVPDGTRFLVPEPTQGLRPGLYSCAASRLGA